MNETVIEVSKKAAVHEPSKTTGQLFRKITLESDITIYDFDLDLVIGKLEYFLTQLSNEI